MRDMNLFGGKKSAHDLTRSIPRSVRAEERRELLIRLVHFLQESPYLSEDTVIYKGGLFLGEHTGISRYTQDVDASIVSASIYSRVKKTLSLFGETLIGEGIIDSFKVADEVLPGKSGGASFYAKSGIVLFSVDISLEGDIPLDCELVETKLGGTLHLTTLEQVLCDKLSVLYSKSRFRRAKDLYDTWLILTTTEPNIDKLISLLYARDKYPLPLKEAPFREEYIIDMRHAYDKFVLLDAETGTPKDKPLFSEVVTVVGSFLVRFMEDDT